MWNGLYTAEKMVIQWTLLSEACYFTVQFLGDLTISVHSLIGLLCPFVPKNRTIFCYLTFTSYVSGTVNPVI